MSYLYISEYYSQSASNKNTTVAILSLEMLPDELHTLADHYLINKNTTVITIQHTYSRMVKEALSQAWNIQNILHTPEYLILNISTDEVWQGVKALKGHPQQWPIKEQLYAMYKNYLTTELQKNSVSQDDELINWFIEACVLLGSVEDYYVKAAHMYQKYLLQHNNESTAHQILTVQALRDYLGEEKVFNLNYLSALFMLAELKEDIHPLIDELWIKLSITDRHVLAEQLIQEWLACEKSPEDAPVLLQQCLFYNKSIIPKDILLELQADSIQDIAAQQWLKNAQQPFALIYLKENPFVVAIACALILGTLLYGSGMLFAGILLVGVLGMLIAIYKKIFKKSS